MRYYCFLLSREIWSSYRRLYCFLQRLNAGIPTAVFFFSKFWFGTNDKKYDWPAALFSWVCGSSVLSLPSGDVLYRLRLIWPQPHCWLSQGNRQPRIVLFWGTVITAFPMKVSPGSKTLSCINKSCFVRVLLAVMCLSGNSCLMAASVSL